MQGIKRGVSTILVSNLKKTWNTQTQRIRMKIFKKISEKEEGFKLSTRLKWLRIGSNRRSLWIW
jgi:hypothetical protein